MEISTLHCTKAELIILRTALDNLYKKCNKLETDDFVLNMENEDLILNLTAQVIGQLELLNKE